MLLFEIIANKKFLKKTSKKNSKESFKKTQFNIKAVVILAQKI